MSTIEDHRLLMEALMFFSSGEDHDDNSSTSSVDSDHETSTLDLGCVQSSRIFLRELSPLDTIPQHVPVEIPPTKFYHDDHHHAVAATTRKRSPPPISPQAKLPLRRKRNKKCTYAARREEVARLRSCTQQLEAQLVHLQKRERSSGAIYHHAQYERDLLVQSRAENARLRALIAENDATISKAQGKQQLW